jgi:NADH-ubiquinone oxidoreductase chain 4
MPKERETPSLSFLFTSPCRRAGRTRGRKKGDEFLMIAVFRMLDLLLFYILPESVLIPILCGAEHLLFAGINLFLCRGLVQ